SGEGVHGGELRFLDKEGVPWVIRRYSRSREGHSATGRGERVHIHKLADNGSVIELGQQELEQYALGGVSRDMFRQLFAISLSELQEIRSLQSAEMSGYLFHAGIGGGANILEAERKLSQEMDKLYKPRGKVQHTAKLLQSIEHLRTQVSESKMYVSRY
ncbi:AAA family ATPase, partial [Clostridium perfringens]